jgi:hypothetical protein
MPRILFVGNLGGTNVATSFSSAGLDLGYEVSVIEPKIAYQGFYPLKKINWLLLGRMPSSIKVFNEKFLAEVNSFKPAVIITFGISPPFSDLIKHIRKMGVVFANFLTDDPWSANKACWFVDSIKNYDFVFCTKSKVLIDCKYENPRSFFLPFGYDSHLFGLNQRKDFIGDIFDVYFAGGADGDRIPMLKLLIDTGMKVGIHGGYWNLDSSTKKSWLGHGNPKELCCYTSSSRISLCLVRRANRDGHVMRTFEAAASGGCMLVEDTEEHREIFGADGECVVYFSSDAEMVTKAKWLLGHPEERFRLRKAVYKKIVVDGENTYHDRLKFILQKMGKSEK